jgi:hypothetical protein
MPNYILDTNIRKLEYKIVVVVVVLAQIENSIAKGIQNTTNLAKIA